MKLPLADPSPADREPAQGTDRAPGRQGFGARLKSRLRSGLFVATGFAFAGLWYCAIGWLAWRIL